MNELNKVVVYRVKGRHSAEDKPVIRFDIMVSMSSLALAMVEEVVRSTIAAEFGDSYEPKIEFKSVRLIGRASMLSETE